MECTTLLGGECEVLLTVVEKDHPRNTNSLNFTIKRARSQCFLSFLEQQIPLLSVFVKTGDIWRRCWHNVVMKLRINIICLFSTQLADLYLPGLQRLKEPKLGYRKLSVVTIIVPFGAQNWTISKYSSVFNLGRRLKREYARGVLWRVNAEFRQCLFSKIFQRL